MAALYMTDADLKKGDRRHETAGALLNLPDQDCLLPGKLHACRIRLKGVFSAEAVHRQRTQTNILEVQRVMLHAFLHRHQ